MSATQPRQSVEPVDGHTGWKSRPRGSFGKKYVVFCGITSPRRGDARRRPRCGVGRSRNAPSNSPRVDRARRPRRSRPCSRRPRDRRAGRRARRRARPARPSTTSAAPAAVADRDGGAVVRKRVEPRERLAGRDRRRSPAAAPRRARRKSRWVGKISSPGSVVETSTTIIRALSGVPSSAANATAVS